MTELTWKREREVRGVKGKEVQGKKEEKKRVFLPEGGERRRRWKLAGITPESGRSSPEFFEIEKKSKRRRGGRGRERGAGKERKRG